MANTEAETILELEREACRRFQQGDIDWVMDHVIMEDGMLFPPGGERLTGRETQRALFKEFLQMEGASLSWEPLEAFVSKSNDMAWVHGSVLAKMPGAPEEPGKFVSIWMKADGRWQNVVEIRNSNLP